MENRTKKHRRCFHCGKKITTVFRGCRCKNIFCNGCIAPETHSCPNIEEFKQARVESQ